MLGRKNTIIYSVNERILLTLDEYLIGFYQNKVKLLKANVLL